MKILEKIKIDLIVRSRDSYKNAILSLVERDEKAIILDLGCGDYKRITEKVVKKIGSQHLYGIDMDIGKSSGGMVVFEGDLNKEFPVGNLRFDVVIASQIIEHLWNTDGFLKEIHRYLKPTGYAIISTPNLAAWHNRLYLLFGKQPEPCKVSDEMFPDHEKPGHLRVFTASGLIKLLKFHNFKVEKVIKTFGNVTVKVRK
jgi:2-polyprenyl-3-methyl-5-hydroxy-6-metoxy-1,4-benzoquinol methylase